jgi:hypothetical protein
MSCSSLVLSSTATVIDMTVAGTTTYGTGARKTVGNTRTLWSGNVNGNGDLRYTGDSNDRDPILAAIGGSLPTATVQGYLLADVNLDGTVRYTGQNNDRDPILNNIGGGVPTGQVLQQLP